MDDLAARAWTGFSEALRAFIRRRVSDPHDAEDLLQDVFFRIHQRGHQLERGERLRPWLYQITRHAIVDYYRARAALPGSVELPPDLCAKPEPQAVIDELAGCLRPMIERLPEGYRRAVIMADLEGRTQQDTAAALGLSLSGAKSRIQRGRRRLRTMVLACCHLEVDGGGRVINYTPRDPSCSRCAP